MWRLTGLILAESQPQTLWISSLYCIWVLGLFEPSYTITCQPEVFYQVFSPSGTQHFATGWLLPFSESKKTNTSTVKPNRAVMYGKPTVFPTATDAFYTIRANTLNLHFQTSLRSTTGWITKSRTDIHISITMNCNHFTTTVCMITR